MNNLTTPFLHVTISASHRSPLNLKELESSGYSVFSEAKKCQNGNYLTIVNIDRVWRVGQIKSAYNTEHKFYLLVNGDYFLSSEQESLLTKICFPLDGQSIWDLELLFTSGGLKALLGLRGEFNLVIVYPEEMKIVCISSFMGMLPLYYTINTYGIEVCTDLSNLDLYYARKLNYLVLAQMCLYNYSLSDKSLLEGVDILPPASVLTYEDRKFTISPYWDPNCLLERSVLNRKQSFESIDCAFHESLRRISSLSEKCSVSLTGGWDGRLVLAFMLNLKNKNNIHTYSFGTSESLDVIIPQEIARAIGISYSPNILDEAYLEQEFLSAAIQTVLNSDGQRGFQKAHYLATMKALQSYSSLVISGNCGSNLMKGVATHPSVVFNAFIIQLMGTNNPAEIFENHFGYLQGLGISEFCDIRKDEFIDTLHNGLLRDVCSIKEYSNRFSRFIMSFTERKYFGVELTSYRNFVSNHSPFIDFDFINALSQTRYYNSGKSSRYLYSNWENNILYAKLVDKRYKDLTFFVSDKGVSLRELLNPLKYPLIMRKKLSLGRSTQATHYDPYNSKKSMQLFVKYANRIDDRICGLAESHPRILESYLSVVTWFDNYSSCRENTWK